MASIMYRVGYFYFIYNHTSMTLAPRKKIMSTPLTTVHDSLTKNNYDRIDIVCSLYSIGMYFVIGYRYILVRHSPSARASLYVAFLLLN